MEADWHKDLILDQFSKQAIPFPKIMEIIFTENFKEAQNIL